MVKKLIVVIAAVLLLDVGFAVAGTVGMTGLWTFDGTATGQGGAFPFPGEFDFDADTVNLVGDPFFGALQTITGTIVDNLDGTYLGNLTYYWAAAVQEVDQVWEITDLGNGTASVVSHLVYIPEINPIIIEGTLAATVPLPGSLWLVGAGLAWLAGLGRRRRGH